MIKELIALDDRSKVWVYPADRFISYDEIDYARPTLYDFVNRWSSHGAEVPAYGNIFHRRFLVLFADETRLSGVSGCSIDSSVHFIRALGAKLQVNFFDRLTCHYFKDEEIESIPLAGLQEAYDGNIIDTDTLFFDHTVDSKHKFLTQWIRPIQETWMAQKIRPSFA